MRQRLVKRDKDGKVIEIRWQEPPSTPYFHVSQQDRDKKLRKVRKKNH